MTKELSNKVINIKPSGIRKFFDLVNEMGDVISLGVGEPDFDTPWHVRDEGIYSLEKGKTFYTANSGLKELRNEISNYIKRKQGLEYNPKNEIVVTVGGSEAIDIGLRTIISKNDEVIIPEPSYVSYYPCAVLANAKPIIINLKGEKLNLNLHEFDELKELEIYDGAVVFKHDKDDKFTGGNYFCMIAKIKDGDEVIIKTANLEVKKKFVLDPNLKGTIARLGLSDFNGYNYEVARISKA